MGVNPDGRRAVLGMETGTAEAGPIWTEFLGKLTRRGLRGVKLVISFVGQTVPRTVCCSSSPHEGIKAAVTKVLCSAGRRSPGSSPCPPQPGNAAASTSCAMCWPMPERADGGSSRPSSPRLSPKVKRISDRSGASIARRRQKQPAPNGAPSLTKSDRRCQSWRPSCIEPWVRHRFEKPRRGLSLTCWLK